MALTKGDWSVAANGNIREVAGTSTHQVIEMHRFLMGLLDDTSATDDDLVYVSNGIIPSVRSTDEIISLNVPYNIDATVAQRFYQGSITYNGGNDVYSGLRVVGSVSGTTQVQVIQDNALTTSFWGTDLNAVPSESIIIQMLLKTRTAGADIDDKRVRVQAREDGDTFAEFSVTLGTGFGVAALFTGTDDFYTSGTATIATWDGGAGVINTAGYSQIDVNGDSVDENYICSITKGNRSTNDMYEWGKWVGVRGTATTEFGLSGALLRGITHEITVDTPTGTLVEPEELTWTEAGTVSSGQLLATDSTTAATMVWVQLLTGIAPTDGTVLTGAGAGTITVNVTVTAKTINPNSWLGNYAGSLTGNFGIGVLASDLININDSIRALDNTARNPPNNVNLEATGLVIGDILFAAKTKSHSTTVSGAHAVGDTTLTLASGIPVDYDTIGRLIVDGEEVTFTGYSGADVTIGGTGLPSILSGGEAVTVTQFYNDEFTTTADAGTVNGAADVIVEFDAAIGSAWPATGVVWLWDGVDRYDEYAYTGISGAQLTGISPALSQSYGLISAYIPFASETATGTSLSVTIVYPGSAVPGRWRLYNSAANITPFEVGFSIGSTGSSTPLTRISDA